MVKCIFLVFAFITSCVICTKNVFHGPAYGLFLSIVTDCDDCDLYSLNKLGQKK